MTLKRGFRAEAERMALQIRQELGLRPVDPLDLRALAARRGVDIVVADSLVPRADLEELERLQAFAFSACTFDVDGTQVIVVSPLRSTSRQTSDIAHELSHILLRHQLTEIREIAGITFRTCRTDQEEEATSLGGTLLLPRPLLIRAVSRGMSIDQIAKTYAVTADMARFRVNTTGVIKQVSARASRPG
jgi:Zn-dependent peptidase ImmA (M78 family)